MTGFKLLSSSRDEARYEVRLEPPYGAAYPAAVRTPFTNLTVAPQVVEKILRERHQMRGQDFVFNLKSEYPVREQVMQYGGGRPDVCLTPAVGSGYLVPVRHRRPAENRSYRILRRPERL
ncbi:MAG: hypothetical protein ACLR31_21470 [Escherichia coli]